LPAFLPPHLLTYLPIYLPTYLITYFPNYLVAYFHYCNWRGGVKVYFRAWLHLFKTATSRHCTATPYEYLRLSWTVEYFALMTEDGACSSVKVCAKSSLKNISPALDLSGNETV